MSVFTIAAKLLTLRLFAVQWIIALLLALAAVAWLQIPDSHAWQFALSVVYAAAWIVLALWFYARTFAKLDAQSNVSLWRRMLAIVIAVAIFYCVLWLIALGRAHEILYAGYWNSRLSAGSRATFTYERLRLWQEWFYTAVAWLALVLLAPLAFTGARAREFAAILKRIAYWLVAFATGLVAFWITNELLRWTPGKSAKAQVASLLLRLLIAYSADVFLWCCLLATMAASADASRSNPNHAD